jgi:hypothetical protein
MNWFNKIFRKKVTDSSASAAPPPCEPVGEGLELSCPRCGGVFQVPEDTKGALFFELDLAEKKLRGGGGPMVVRMGDGSAGEGYACALCSQPSSHEDWVRAGYWINGRHFRA